MVEVFKKDKKSIEQIVETQIKEGKVVTAKRLNLPQVDQVTTITKIRNVYDAVLSDNGGSFSILKDKLASQKKEAPIERVVKEKVAAVSNTIHSMRRMKPTESNIYCMTTEEMKKRAVMVITSPSTVHDFNTFGLSDKHLGCIEKGKTCVKCFRKYGKCEGHEGFIPFERKHINPLFYKNVIYALRATCPACGHVFANKDVIKAIGLNKLSGLNYAKALAEVSDDLHMLHKHDRYIREYYESTMRDHKIAYRLATDKGADFYEKPIDNIEYVFRNYTQEDLEILGYTGETKPISFIMGGILTISPHLRLPGFVNDKQTNHPLTERYISIIKANMQLRNNKESSIEATNQVLASQYTKIKEIFFGSENKNSSRVVEQECGLMPTLTRKKGLLRFHAMGKRVDSSCRAPANSSVDGNTGEIGIPRYARKNITVREKVHIYNRKKLSAGIRSGEIKYIIVLIDGIETKREIKENNRRTFRLEIGHIVERPIQNGDIVLCGRQPSLHAASLMGFRVYLHDDEVIKVSIENLAPFNLDFDGDEVTFHIIQTVPAQVEAITTASSLHHVMNEQSNRAMIAAAFHALLGSYLSTETWHYVTHSEFNDDEFDADYDFDPQSVHSVDEIIPLDGQKHGALYNLIYQILIKDVTRVNKWLKLDHKPEHRSKNNKSKKSCVKMYRKLMSKVYKFEKTTLRDVESGLTGFAMRNINSYIKNIRQELYDIRCKTKDLITSFYRAKHRNVMIPPERFNQALSLINDSHRKASLKARCAKFGIEYYSGRSLISVVFPENLTYVHGKPGDSDHIEIRNGILVKGILRKSNIGTGEKSLVQVIYKLYSTKEADRFINEILKIADWFVMWHGFSIGHHSFVTNRKEIRGKIFNEINLIQGRFYNLGPMPTDPTELFFWKRVLHGMMDRVLQMGKEIGNKVLLKSNPLNVLGTDGCAAKGSYMNTSQITALLGCQKIKGDIQEAEFNGGTRVLVTFLPGDCSLESIGYVSQSFYDGMTPSALFSHMSASREGLVDTANNTSVIGYTHRRLEKALEDTIFNSRGMISSISGKIYVFTYSCISVANQVFINSETHGKHLSFCNFSNIQDMVNGLYNDMSESIEMQ